MGCGWSSELVEAYLKQVRFKITMRSRGEGWTFEAGQYLKVC